LVPLSLASSVLLLHAAATLVIVALALWDIHTERVRLRSA
jgi:hypothetical protein